MKRETFREFVARRQREFKECEENKPVSKLRLWLAIIVGWIIAIMLINMIAICVEAKEKSKIIFTRDSRIFKIKREKIVIVTPPPIKVLPKQKDVTPKAQRVDNQFTIKKKELTIPQTPSVSEVINVIKQYDWDTRLASAIFYQESTFRPVMNSIGACGITQLYRCPNINWRDTKTNIDYAYWNKYMPSLRQRGDGWLPWEGYTTGRYKKFLYMF